MNVRHSSTHMEFPVYHGSCFKSFLVCMCFLQKLLLGRTKGILLSYKEVLEELYLCFIIFLFCFFFFLVGVLCFSLQQIGNKPNN